MDFTKLGRINVSQKSIHPIEIFEKLPNLPGTPNDIWRGQTQALTQWHENRQSTDVLVSLNTGAGKTLVGLLIAQSLVNEGVQNVIYACATIDLVKQTAKTAESVGIPYTTRTQGEYSNDLFESGKAFCITTYHALFNGLSSIGRKHFPGALILDDAHVAESMLRTAMTLTITSKEDAPLYKEICRLFENHFVGLGKRRDFLETTSQQIPNIMMAAPTACAEHKEQLSTLIDQYIRQRQQQGRESDLVYPYGHLKDHLDRCAILFGMGGIEITPPFLPSLALDYFDRPIRRVYLSATLNYKTDFVRAFGRLPKVIIEPKNDAGNGERLILFSNPILGGIDPNLVGSISRKHKVLLAVPNYKAAESWRAVGVPPEKNNFSRELDNFRRADTGTFVSVSRNDGIDLPHDSCRIMVIDGMPSGSTLLERYQWEILRMGNMYVARFTNRLVQLFGRINRGRNDYGVFLINNKSLNTWLNNDRNVALFPELLRQQILLGREVQEGMNIKTATSVSEIINAVLNRDPSWLKFYGDTINESKLDSDKVDRAADIEEKLVAAALAEASFAVAAWDGEYAEARSVLDSTIEQTARADELLAGWHNIWVGTCYDREGDRESAFFSYQRAKKRLGRMVNLPQKPVVAVSTEAQDEFNAFGEALNELLSVQSANSFDRELRRLKAAMADLDGASSRQMEESVRQLGEALGFASSRPDNEHDTGPDVLWCDEENAQCIALELKTDKQKNAKYSKKDISQAHDSLEWVANNKKEYVCLGLIFIGPDGACDQSANPSDEMWLASPSELADLRDELFSMISDIRKKTPVERIIDIKKRSEEEKWQLQEIVDQLQHTRLNETK